ncbi:MAG: hypothetical protein IIW02_02370 [Clostridia bacterium]|nr:hypothetical protein [Clostridia bacterium]
MKNKKLFIPTIILIAAILASATYMVISSIAKKPTTTEGEFLFSITYELDGETVTINDVYRARFVKNDGFANTKSRMYVGEIGNRGENNTIYILKEDENTCVELRTNFYPDYLMGDPEYDYFDEKAFEPQIYYYDAEEQEYSDEETLLAQGIKLIGFEYPTPIENSLVFSHISYLSSAVVLPTLIIALLALVAIIIFVKKDKELKYKAIDIVSLVLNFVIGFALIPYISIAAMLIDINGGGPDFHYQVFYFFPLIFVLCIAASIALRRKGYGVKALVTELIGPVVFALFLVVCGVLGLL